MNRKKYIKETLLLFISEHKALCRICSYIQYIRIRTGLKKDLKAQVEKTMNTFNTTWGGGISRCIVLLLSLSY